MYIIRARTVPNRPRDTSSNLSADSRKKRKFPSASALSFSFSTTKLLFSPTASTVEASRNAAPANRPEVDGEAGVDDGVAQRAPKRRVEDVDALLGRHEEPVAGRVVGEVGHRAAQAGPRRASWRITASTGSPASGPDAGSTLATFTSGFSLAHRPRSDTGAVESSFNIPAIASPWLVRSQTLWHRPPNRSSMIWPMYGSRS